MVFFITIAVYVFLKTLLFFRAPSTLSLDEIDLLTRYTIWLPAGLPLHKIATGICGVFALYAVWRFLRQNKAVTILQIGALVTLATSPYFLLITNYLGVSLYVLLGSAFMLMLQNRRWAIAGLVALILLSAMHFGFQLIALSELSALVDLDLLFFDAKSMPLSLAIPASGLLPFFTIIPFCSGLYGILRSAFLWTQLKKGSLFVIYALFCIFFLHIPLYVKLIPLLMLVSFVTGYGYHYLIHRLHVQAHRIIVFLLLISPALIGIVYSTEILMNHFDKKTSVEWGTAEMNTLEWIFKHPHLTYYASPESDKLIRYYVFFTKQRGNARLNKVEFTQMAHLCSLKGSACVLRFHELDKLNYRAEKAVFRATFADGSMVYYYIVIN